MSGRTDDRLLQDYLDGRLEDRERAAFEERLSHEPGLARKLEACREIGRALREDEPELSPGFYTRARARFEAAAKPRRGPLARLVSWEAAGLAAAAALAVALFLPPSSRMDLQLSAPIADGAPDAVTESRVWEQTDSDLEFAPSPEPEKQKRMTEEEKVGDAPPPAASRMLGQAVAPADEPAGRGDAEPKGARPRREGGEDTRKKLERVQAAAPPAERSAQKEAALDESARMEFADSLKSADLDGRVRELPAGIVAPGVVRTVTEEHEWSELGRSAVAAGLEPPPPWSPRRRLVLIGPLRVPFDCAGVVVLREDAGYLIRLPATPSGGSPGGCALVLPRDGLPVTVEEGRSDRE